MSDYDTSAAAQYAAFGRAASRHQADRPEPARIAGLAALGRYVGSADSHPVRDAGPALAMRRPRSNLAA